MPQSKTRSSWTFTRMTGLAETLEAAMMVDAFLGELEDLWQECHDLYTESPEAWPGSAKETEALERAGRRLHPIREKIRYFIVSLGQGFMWGGPTALPDDLEPGSPEDLELKGIARSIHIAQCRDRDSYQKHLITQGRELLAVFRQARGVAAAVNMAVDSLIDYFHESENNSEETQSNLLEGGFDCEALESLIYWQDQYWDCIRDIFTEYRDVIEGLQKAETPR